MKTRDADENSPFNYSPECHIEYADDHRITWVFDYGDDYDWSSTAKEEGIVIGHSHDIVRCQVTMTNGTLKFSDQYIVTYYDKQGRTITTKNYGAYIIKKPFTLYKEDTDW